MAIQYKYLPCTFTWVIGVCRNSVSHFVARSFNDTGRLTPKAWTAFSREEFTIHFFVAFRTTRTANVITVVHPGGPTSAEK